MTTTTKPERTMTRELLVALAAAVLGFPLALLFVQTGIPQAFGAWLMANPLAMAATLVAAVVGHQLGERRVIRMTREKHGPNYCRRWLLASAAVFSVFAVVFVCIATLKNPSSLTASESMLIYSLPVYLLFVAWQDWRRYRAPDTEPPPVG